MNKDLLIKGMIFLAGGAIGSVVTWKLVKTKYEKIANEEIDSMREYYYNKKDIQNEEETSEEDSNEEKEMSITDIRKKLEEMKYAAEVENEKEDEKDMGGPEVIPPEETWEQDYPTITLTYYAEDDVLADDQDNILDDIEELVGVDFRDHFGEYEDDCVYVKNPEMEVYYEILRVYERHPDLINEEN